MAGVDQFDFSGVNFSLDGNALAEALVPMLIPVLAAQLSANPTLQASIVNAIMPQLRAQMLQIARSTGGTGTTTGRTP